MAGHRADQLRADGPLPGSGAGAAGAVVAEHVPGEISFPPCTVDIEGLCCNLLLQRICFLLQPPSSKDLLFVATSFFKGFAFCCSLLLQRICFLLQPPSSKDLLLGCVIRTSADRSCPPPKSHTHRSAPLPLRPEHGTQHLERKKLSAKRHSAARSKPAILWQLGCANFSRGAPFFPIWAVTYLQSDLNIQVGLSV